MVWGGGILRCEKFISSYAPSSKLPQLISTKVNKWKGVFSLLDPFYMQALSFYYVCISFTESCNFGDISDVSTRLNPFE